MRLTTNPRSLFLFTLYISVIVVLAFLGSFYRGYSLSHDKAGISYSKGAYFLTNIGYLDLPRVNINIAGPSQNEESLKVRADISLEIKKEYSEKIEHYLPRIADRITQYLYAQPVDKLRNLHNQKIMRRELLSEVNDTGMPVPVADVIFRQYLVL
jgi:flagellar basal body-associated protein FliL